ncbi:MAG: glutamate synthase large subunit [Sphingomonadaceae bacterium]|nr:glutamate synthase large subunit [Sphingomonadaceae bacterium]
MTMPAPLYDPADEHDSCGVGLIAETSGQPTRRAVAHAITALKNLWHRGAVDADGLTGDGAGVMLELPVRFFHDHIAGTAHRPGSELLGVGQMFLPRTSLADQEACRTIIESAVIGFGYRVYGWRQVPVDTSVIGAKAAATRPEIEQIMIAGPEDGGAAARDAFERDLYLIRRRIERQAIAAQIPGFYVCSLSCRTIIYKGLFLAQSIDRFYPDLADEQFVSRFAIYHQRYSTNTFPQWWLAQPFRCIAHNGEINTLRGNRNWMRSHEIRMASLAFGAAKEDVKPVIPAGASDTGALDAVFELLVRAGRDAPTAKLMLVPEAFGPELPPAHAAMYAYFSSLMEPWDGPAALAMTDGRFAIVGADRNALRPMRWALTRDGLFVSGSEAGIVPLDEAELTAKGRLGPGEMAGVDLDAGTVLCDEALKDRIAAQADYAALVAPVRGLADIAPPAPEPGPRLSAPDLTRQLIAAGRSHEDLELILRPMVEDAKEAVGSMGDDTPLAVISNRPRCLSSFFRQNFAQVTNPPIDSLREGRTMTLRTRFGNFRNLLDPPRPLDGVLVLDSPVITNREWDALIGHFGVKVGRIDCTFPAGGGPAGLRAAIERARAEAEAHVRAGRTELFLSDEGAGPERVAVPMILAAAGVHSHLVSAGLRTYASLNVRAAQALDTHYVAVLIGVGSTTVNAWLTQEAIVDAHARGLYGGLGLDEAVARYRQAVSDGLLKVLAKMGISVISSYRGGYNFEAVGLSRAILADLMPGLPGRISGEGYTSIHLNCQLRHRAAFGEGRPRLAIGGLYKERADGEAHGWGGEEIHVLQSAVAAGSYQGYLTYSRMVAAKPPIALRDLLAFTETRPPVPIEEVESVNAIRRRFVTPGMSLGALSPEAHETLAIAMNRISARAVSGEGGEDAARFTPRLNGDNANSTTKQIASGRFGVTAEYLNACDEIEIKVAQGAKPGEGGQLPGFKVTELIAKLRHATPGVSLISPPPHHDIYSIEDLAQLIYDLKQVNPDARVCVKLVSSAGIGTIAAGVAKAHADVILVSGHVGGTGASPQTSIKYAGSPWEMGLAEANQVLTLNGLRHRVKLRADGGLKTGRDIVIAAILGAEEFGIGTLSLVAMGCIMVRQCHSNTCPVGVCTQDEALRAKFGGSPEKVINLMTFIAEETREILARLGYRSLDEVIGRTDLLTQTSRGHEYLDDLDLNPLLAKVDAPDAQRRFSLNAWRNPVPDTLDAEIVADSARLFERGERVQLAYNIRNTHRAVGARTSSAIVRRFGPDGLAPGHLHLRLRGSAGQSLGAFGARGLTIELFGEANDYVGKGLSGATIIVRPMISSPLVSNENTILGNTCLYGATSGELYAAGQAGERFAVRNSGAVAVLEGCGANGCEYMTGGEVVVLGPTGANFGAGMTGGMAWVLDVDGQFARRLNPDSVVAIGLSSRWWEERLHTHIAAHAAATGSAWASTILDEWELRRGQFVQICPKEMLARLDHPLSAAEMQAAE